MRRLTVILEAQLPNDALLGDVADALMDALIDLGAEDPFVFADAGSPSLRVEIVVEALTEPEALSTGVALIVSALRSTADTLESLPVESVSARTADLIPA